MIRISTLSRKILFLHTASAVLSFQIVYWLFPDLLRKSNYYLLQHLLPTVLHTSTPTSNAAAFSHIFSNFLIFYISLSVFADSELEELETTPRYRPDSLSALCRATRFSEAEIKRIYRGFKAECPTGVVKEDTFKIIYSQFFPQGGLYTFFLFRFFFQIYFLARQVRVRFFDLPYPFWT